MSWRFHANKRVQPSTPRSEYNYKTSVNYVVEVSRKQTRSTFHSSLDLKMFTFLNLARRGGAGNRTRVL